MIKIINGNLTDSKENFIVNLVDCQGYSQMKHHVEKEYLKYLKHYNKVEEDIHGKVQYVPNDIWAICMVNTIKNKDVIAYDNEYQYIVNLFGQDNRCHNKENFKYIKIGLKDIFNKAKNINATIAIAYGLGKENWNNVYNEIKHMSEKFNVDVYLYKLNK